MTNVIKRKDLDKKFTEAVAKYMSKGMWIATQSMNGHQGEEGKVDLTDGKNTYRVLAYKQHEMFQGIYVIEVRKYDGYVTNGMHTLWNDKGELVETVCRMYEIETRGRGGNVYVETKEEAKKIKDLQIDRYKGFGLGWKEIRFDADAVAEAVRATNTHGYKRIKGTDIVKVERRADKAKYKVSIEGKKSITIG